MSQINFFNLNFIFFRSWVLFVGVNFNALGLFFCLEFTHVEMIILESIPLGEIPMARSPLRFFSITHYCKFILRHNPCCKINFFKLNFVFLGSGMLFWLILMLWVYFFCLDLPTRK